MAVNPKDERYTAIVGRQIALPLTDRTIPVIADDYVDLEFGTGCVKVTPAHDPNDFEIGRRHDLPPTRCVTQPRRPAPLTAACGPAVCVTVGISPSIA